MEWQYIRSDESYEPTMNYSRALGIAPIMLGLIAKKSTSPKEGKYVLESSRLRAKTAEEVFQKPNSRIEAIIKDYEIMLDRIEKQEIIPSPNTNDRPCNICRQSSLGAFETCPICLDVYHEKFRNNFLERLNSCDALQILDGVR